MLGIAVVGLRTGVEPRAAKPFRGAHIWNDERIHARRLYNPRSIAGRLPIHGRTEWD